MTTSTPTTFADKQKQAALHEAAAVRVLEGIHRDLEAAAALFSKSATFSQETGQYSQHSANGKIVCESVKTRLREVREAIAKTQAAKQAALDQTRAYDAMAQRAKFSDTDRAL